MQLKKQAIRKMPTNYTDKHMPGTVRRQESDFNQVNNTRQRHRNKFGDTF